MPILLESVSKRLWFPSGKHFPCWMESMGKTALCVKGKTSTTYAIAGQWWEILGAMVDEVT
jgi:hypothetical protein